MVSRREFLYYSAGTVAAASVTGAAHAMAPMLGAKPANIQRYKFGGFELTAIRDGQVTLDKPQSVFGTDQTVENVANFSKRYFLPTDKHVLQFTPVVVNTGKELVLIDTGWGSGNPGRGELAGSLKAAGYTADQFDVVILSHCHPDHMGGLMDGDKPVFPNARYVMGEGEYNFWTNPNQSTGGTADFYKLTKAKVSPLAPKMTFVKDQGTAVSGITAISTPGHTPGHTSWRLESSGKQMIVTADTCNHATLSMEHPKWHVLFDMDKAKATKTRLKMLDMLAHDRIPFTGYHMPFPAVGFVEKHVSPELYYHYEPATYQFML